MTTLKIKEPRLTPTLRSLCGRLANERCKAAVWAESARLRQFARARLAEGESEVQVVAWLASQLSLAQAGQRDG